MRKRKQYQMRKTGFPALALFLCGFLLGNLLPNLLWRAKWQQDTLMAVYLLEAFADRQVSGREYLFELLKIRGGAYLFYTLCGFSVFGVPLACVGILLLGGELGALLAMSVLEFGLDGGLVGVGLLMPQYVIYVPVWLLLLSWVYELSLGIWKNKGLYPQKTGRFLGKALLGALVYGAGILMEWYLNPWVIEKIMNMTDLF